MGTPQATWEEFSSKWYETTVIVSTISFYPFWGGSGGGGGGEGCSNGMKTKVKFCFMQLPHCLCSCQTSLNVL